MNEHYHSCFEICRYVCMYAYHVASWKHTSTRASARISYGRTNYFFKGFKGNAIDTNGGSDRQIGFRLFIHSTCLKEGDLIVWHHIVITLYKRLFFGYYSKGWNHTALGFDPIERLEPSG